MIIMPMYKLKNLIIRISIFRITQLFCIIIICLHVGGKANLENWNFTEGMTWVHKFYSTAKKFTANNKMIVLQCSSCAVGQQRW